MSGQRTMLKLLFPPREDAADPQFIARVMFHWDRKLDTAEIAKRLCPGMKHGESVVCVALERGREQRRQERG